MKKNNKKGFTLIELLAVIVILAILATAAFTLVLPRIEEARKKSFVTEIGGVMDAADQYFFDNAREECFVINETNGKKYLKNFDADNMKGVVKKNTQGGNTVSYTNGTYQTSGTDLYTMSQLQKKGVPTDIIVTGSDAASQCS